MALRELQEVIPNEEVLQTLRELQTSKHTIGGDAANDITFLHGEPNCGNTSRIPLALSMLRGNVPVVCLQPTDAATAYACDVVKGVVDPAASVGHIPQTQAFNMDLMRSHKVLYVSARQFLLHSEEILQHASVIIVDEIHYSSVDHELSAVLLRERYRQKVLPLRASIFLMSSYIQASEMPEPLFETTTTVQTGRPDNSETPSLVFKHDVEDRVDVDGYMETVISAFKQIKPADGPVLIFVPGKEMPPR